MNNVNLTEKFNYISYTGFRNDENNKIQFSQVCDRLFEFTNANLRLALKGLGENELGLIKSLPTFYCSKLHHGQMQIRYGKLTNLTHNNSNSISADFEVIYDFGNVQINDEDEFNNILKLHKSQIYRGHWAIKFGNVIEILNAIKTYTKSSIIIEVENNGVYAKANVGNVTVKTQNKDTVNSVTNLLDKIYKLKSDDDSEYFFRGQDQIDLKLKPTILRLNNNKKQYSEDVEKNICQEIITEHSQEFQDDKFCFDRLVRMAHYGLPTRLLDISSNPLVALFFACIKNNKEEGEVIIFQVSSKNIKYYDSDTVTLISHISNLNKIGKENIKNFIDNPKPMKSVSGITFNDEQDYSNLQDLLHSVKSDKPEFRLRGYPQDLSKIICVKAKKNNLRIKSQSGAFFIFGHEALLEDDKFIQEKLGIQIIRLRIKDKIRILKELDKININSKTMYPGMSETAETLKMRFLDKN